MASAVDFEKELFLILRNSPELKTLVEDKIFALFIPIGTKLPCITYQRTGGEPALVISGFSGLEKIELQIDVWARDYGEAKKLAQAVRKVMPVKKPFGSRLEQDHDSYDPKSQYYRISMDWVCWFSEGQLPPVPYSHKETANA